MVLGTVGPGNGAVRSEPKAKKKDEEYNGSARQARDQALKPSDGYNGSAEQARDQASKPDRSQPAGNQPRGRYVDYYTRQPTNFSR